MQVSSARSRIFVGCGALLLASMALIGIRSSDASASTLAQIDLLNPAGDQPESEFGQHVTVLPNGNILVNDPSYDADAVIDVGAVYLFNGTTLALISTLTGTVSGDHVGWAVEVLSNGNVVVYSPGWDNGSIVDAGAVTWVNSATGVSGEVSAANSLVGASSDERVGTGNVLPLSNGNYLVASPGWDNGSIVDAGAVTWVNGVSGATGVINAANSLVGSSSNDVIGAFRIAALPNGGYVVPNPRWDSGSIVDAGAVTWGSGAGGVKGVVGAANSLVGSTRFDQTGGDGVLVLSNGNYVARSPYWDNGLAVDSGAVTWGSGARGIAGVVGVANSLVGTTSDELVGREQVVALSNGNYVVGTPRWDNGSTLDVGAVTWGNGAAGTTGVVGTANSLVGTTRYDEVGGSSIVGLSNGNYVVTTPYWDNGVLLDVGAVTWVSGTTPTTGVIGVTNSLVGSTVSDRVGSGVVALPNGSYVVVSGFWNNGSIVEAGAVTWVSGATRTTGVIGPANSLVGSSVENRLGVGGIVVLPNGNYLVVNPFWLNPSQGIAGAVTWASGATGITGVVGPTNSLVGTSDRDRVGSDGVVLLPNGNYLVSSRQWDDGPAADVGAVTWGSGATGITGVVSSANSLIGSTSKDDVGYNIIVLSDGNYVVLSPNWDNGPALDAGAVTWGNSATGTSGVVGAANSLVGMVYNEGIGTGVGVLSNGNYVVSRGWGPDGGAVTWVKGSASFAGVASAENSLVGTASDGLATFVDRSQSVVTNDDGSYIVLSQYWDHGVASFGAATYGPASGITGVISFANSAVGTVPGRFLDVAERRTSAGAYAIATNQNRVVLLFPGTPRVPPISTAPGVPPVNPGPGAAPTEFVPLSPGRLADTRPSGVTVDSVFAAGGTRAADSTLELTVGGRGGVLTTAQAVSLNITAVDASADGYATVFPCGSPRPNASNLNYRAGHTQANAVITKLGTSGKVCVYVSSATQLIVDVNGSFPVTSLLVSANPARVLDTRATGETVDNLERAGGLRAAGSITTLPIAGRADVPADAKAVIVNVTATGPTNDGYLTVYPCGSPVPNASNLNYTSATSIANLVISKLGAGGQLCIKTSAATHLIVDVTGYFPAGSAYEPLQPARLLDSRAAGVTIDNQFPAAGLRPAGTITELTVGGRGGVTGDAKTLVLNITATDPTADGFISVYPCGIAPPNASNLNFAANSDVANTVIVKPGTAGKVCLYNSSPTHLIADANGYLLT